MIHDTQIRVGLIGCGNIGARAHAPVYRDLPETALAAVCDVDESLMQAIVSTGPDPAVAPASFTDYRRLLEQPGIDMVDLCVPTFLHAPLAIAALDAGKHVLCEKPMACTLAEADAMVAAAGRNDRKLMIGHVRRFDPRYVEIKAAIDRGEVGRPVFVRRAERQRLPFAADTWYWRPELGGGVILDIGIHATDLFRWYFGAEPESVYAVGRQVREVARQADSFDHAFITYHFPGRRVGLVEASWAYPGNFGAYYASLDVVGTLGKLQYSDLDTNPMLVVDEDAGALHPRYFQFMSTTEHAFAAEIRHFVRCLLDGAEPAITPADARAALEMALAAQCSAATGQPVSLPLEADAPCLH